jgi:hypothetical protein
LHKGRRQYPQASDSDLRPYGNYATAGVAHLEPEIFRDDDPFIIRERERFEKARAGLRARIDASAGQRSSSTARIEKMDLSLQQVYEVFDALERDGLA